MQNKKILREAGEQIKAMVKELLERLMREEWALSLAEHPTKANGCSTRHLLTLAGPLGTSRSPYPRRGVSSSDPPLPAAYVSGAFGSYLSMLRGEHPSHPPLLEGIYGAFYSPQSISRFTQVVKEEVQAWGERPLSEEYYAVFLDGTFSSVRQGKTDKEPVYIVLGLKPDGRREILGFWLFGAEGESARNWRRY